MKRLGKAITAVLLACFLVAGTWIPASPAAEEASFRINGQKLQVPVNVENGISTMSVLDLNAIPYVSLDGTEPVALRTFFEGQGAVVHWDAEADEVVVSWNESRDGMTAQELLGRSDEALRGSGSYRMLGTYRMVMDASGVGLEEEMTIPEMEMTMVAYYRHDPLAIYIIQTVQMPWEEMEVSEEELAEMEELGLLDMTTEMLWTEDAIYQTMPGYGRWVKMDLAGMESMEQLTGMLQASPQQSMEMMQQYGMVNVFGDDLETADDSYYQIGSYMDSAMFRNAMTALLEEFDLTAMLEEFAASAGESQESLEDIGRILDALIASIELNMDYETLINKESLLTERIGMDMVLGMEIDESLMPEGPIRMQIELTGEYVLDSFGEEIVLPDVSDALTQEQYMEELMTQMQN